ncbi:MAG: TrgA family protein [Proteobacteria bacterium]|nr:TrgA family protein [Pseudomonadota bacterium]
MFFSQDTGGRNGTKVLPTAARLAAALWFFAVGWLTALQVLATFPDGTPATYFPLSLAIIGLWQGWSVAGRGVGEGRTVAMAHGLRCAVQMAFFGLVVFSARAVYYRALNMRYDDLADAMEAVLVQFIAYGVQSLTIPIWGVLLAGGVIGGLICEAVARRWR